MPLGRRLEIESLEERVNPNTSLNPLNGGLQILIAGGDTVNLSTAGGMLVVSDTTAGQTISDNTGKFAVAGAAGNQTATENAALTGDFTSITISGTGGGQTVNFIGGSFIATTVNDGTIASVGFATAPSSFVGDLNVLTSTSLTQSAAISGTGAINIAVGGSNAALNLNANITSQDGPVTLQATGDVTVGTGVAIVSTYGLLTLGADLTPAGAGDDGVGTLTISGGTSLYGTTMTLRGAAENIAPTASVGSAVANEEVPTTFGPTTLGSPSGLAFDANGNLYVSNGSANTIDKITPSGVVSTFANITEPTGLAFDQNGNLYVDTMFTVDKITPVGVVSSYANVFYAAGVALDQHGNLYASADYGGLPSLVAIDKVTPSGTLSTFVSDTQGLNGPSGLAVDQSGNLYIANSSGNSILKVTPGGTVSTFIDSSAGIGYPTSLAFDSSGNLYIGSIGKIYKVYLTGLEKVITVFASTGGTYQAGLAFDSSGNLYTEESSTAIGVYAPKSVAVTAYDVNIESSVPSRPMSLGGLNNAMAPGINLTAAELARIVTLSNGVVNFGDETQTGNITISTATLASTAGAETNVLQSLTGGGQIILDDGGGSGTALNGNGGFIGLDAGTGGISSLSANNTAAEIATTGGVYLATLGPIGTSTNRIQFSDSGSTAQQTVFIGGAAFTPAVLPNSVYLDGLGSLNIGSIMVASGAPIDITARGNLTMEGSDHIVNNGSGTISLGADLTAAGAGDDGVGTLTIGAQNTLYGNNITLRGADINISPTATVGYAGYIPAANLAGLNGPAAMAFNSSGDLFVANTGNGTVSEFVPGSITPSATLTGLSSPSSLAFDAAGNLYVANESANTVSVFAPGATTPTATLTGVTSPYLLVVDSSGRLYVANGVPNTKIVSEFAPGATTPSLTLGGPYITNPQALTLDGSGNLYVADAGGTVTKYAPGQTTPSRTLTGISGPSAVAIDASGNVYVASSFNSTVSVYAPASNIATTTLTGLNDPNALAFDSSGNLYVSNWVSETVSKFIPGNTTPSATLIGVGANTGLAFDKSGDLFVLGGSAVYKFVFTTPMSTSVTIRSSLPSRPMSIGGTNNAAVAGINLTNAELATIFTAPNGTITFGDGSQTGNITFSTATPATTPGANIDAVEANNGAGAIVLDDGGGKASGLNGNGGSISLISGTGGIQALSAPNNVPEISNASTVSLTSSTGIGTSNPVELAVISNLTTNTTAANGAQYLNMAGTVGPATLNAGTGTITLAGHGTLALAGSAFNTPLLVDNGAISSGVTVASGQTLEGSGTAGPVTVQRGGFLGSTTAVSRLAASSLNLQGGSTFNVILNGTNSYSVAEILASGTVTLGQTPVSIAKLVIAGTVSPANGQTFTIVNNFGSQPVSGTFSGLPEGAVIPNFLGSSLSATISYVGGDGNDVVLKVGSAAPSATALSASTASSVYGHAVTLTATVTVASGTPAGNVEFFDGTTGADLGAGTLVASGAGTATWTYATTSTQLRVTGASGDLIEALYTSSGAYFGSTGQLAGGETITPYALTVSGVAAANKVYDHTTAATLNLGSAALVGVFSGDAMTLVTSGATGTFASKDVVSTSTPVTVAGLTLTGAQASDYTLTQPTAAANISKAPLTVTGITANNKVYDRTTAVTLNTISAALAGLYSGDAVTLATTGATGKFANSGAGGPQNVAISGLTISGAQTGDYTLTQPTTTATIARAPLTVTGITAANKVFDGTTAATVNTSGAVLAGVLSGDAVTLGTTGATGAFASPNVGNGVTVTVSGLTLSGSQSSDYAITQPTATANITPAPTQFIISNVSSTSITAGGMVTFTATAEDSNNNTVTGYLGTVKLTSTDGSALYNGAALPASYTFVASDNGAHTFTITLQTAGSQTITLTDQANSSTTGTTSPITVSAGPFSKFVLNVEGGNTVGAGNPFLITAQATDALGNPVSGIGVPATITASASPGDPQVNYSINAPVNSSGLALLLGTLQTAGSYTITAGGASTNVTVAPASTDYFTISAPASATVGSAFNITVKAFDRFGNPTPGYAGTVNITSMAPAAFILVPSYTFLAADNGVHTFSVELNSSTLASAGGTTLFVRDMTATSPPITGFSSALAVQGLVVLAGTEGFTARPDGFAVNFSEPLIVADLTEYGSNLTTVPDVTLVGAKYGPIPGSITVDPTIPTQMIFKASSAYLLALNAGDGFGPGGSGDVSAALPDDTYTVTLVSGAGSNGFVDALGNHLDGLGNGTAANYTTTLTTTYQDDAHNNASPTPILAIPDFARGPDSSTTITVPNNKAAAGIPVTLYNVTSSVTDVTFTLTYNPQIFTPSAGGNFDAQAGSTFTMGAITNIDSTHASAIFIYHNPTGHTGTVVLGDIIASVPDSAASIYKTKELLALSNISITGGAQVLASDGIHVDAYLGDVHVTAAPAIDASDALDASKVAAGAWTGFSAYTLLDPALIGGFVLDHAISVDPADVTALFTKAAHGNVPTLPNIPTTVTTVSVGGADPTVSLGAGAETTNGIVSVPVLLTSTQAGSLVNIGFHLLPGAAAPGAAVQLVSQVTVSGQRYVTDVHDDQGPLTLTIGSALAPPTPQTWPGLRNSEAPANSDGTARSGNTEFETLPSSGASEYLSPGHEYSTFLGENADSGSGETLVFISASAESGQSFELGVAAGLNKLLDDNSPGQQAVDWLFQVYKIREDVFGEGLR